MTKTTRHERRKRLIASGAAEARSVSKVKSAGLKHKPSKATSTGLVVRGGKRLVKRPAARKEKGETGAAQKSSPGKGAGGRKKKRPRSQVDEEESGEEGDAQPLVADELTATIQEHDQFFSKMLDMIPEHLVLPAKEVTESSYASKYMKVSNDPAEFKSQSYSYSSYPVCLLVKRCPGCCWSQSVQVAFPARSRRAWLLWCLLWTMQMKMCTFTFVYTDNLHRPRSSLIFAPRAHRLSQQVTTEKSSPEHTSPGVACSSKGAPD